MAILIGLSKYHEQPLIAHKQQSQPDPTTLFLQPRKQQAQLTPGVKNWKKNNALPMIQKAPDTSSNNIHPAVSKPAMPQQKAQKIVQKTIPQETKPEKVEKPSLKKSVEQKKKKSEKKIIPKAKFTHPKKTIESSATENEKEIKRKQVVQPKPKRPQVVQEQEQVPVSPSVPSKGSFSLKDLQKGFTKYLRQGNNAVLSRQGRKDIDPSLEDLKLISYHKQIASTMSSAINYIGRYNSSHLSYDKRNVTIVLTIERDGTISQYKLLQKSRHNELNQHALKIIENMGSLPPLPSYIPAPYDFAQTFVYFHQPGY